MTTDTQEPKPKSETKVAAGRASAISRAKSAAQREHQARERQDLVDALEHAPLETPEHVRDYLTYLLRAVSIGLLEPKAAAAGSSVASKLVRAFEISISQELKALRAEREIWQQSQHNTGSHRRNR